MGGGRKKDEEEKNKCGCLLHATKKNSHFFSFSFWGCSYLNTYPPLDNSSIWKLDANLCHFSCNFYFRSTFENCWLSSFFFQNTLGRRCRFTKESTDEVDGDDGKVKKKKKSHKMTRKQHKNRCRKRNERPEHIYFDSEQTMMTRYVLLLTAKTRPD